MEKKNSKKYVVMNNDLRWTTCVEMEFQCMAICPVPSRPYSGVLKIKYIPKGKLLEWDSFQRWVSSLQNKAFTAENLLDFITSNLWATLNPRHVKTELIIHSAFHLPVKISQVYPLKNEEEEAKA